MISKDLTDHIKRQQEAIVKLEKVITKQSTEIKTLRKIFDIGTFFRHRVMLMCHSGKLLPSVVKEYEEYVRDFDNLSQALKECGNE